MSHEKKSLIFSAAAVVFMSMPWTSYSAVETDAVTHASISISISTTTTTAKLSCTDQYTNGTRTFVYGKTTSYGTNLSPDFDSYRGSGNYTITISNLTASTTYYWKLTSSYNNKTSTFTGSWTTAAATASLPATAASADILITIGNRKVAVQAEKNGIVYVSIHDLQGRQVMKRIVPINGTTVLMPDVKQDRGVYLFRIRSSSGTITGKTFF
jgi:hypothetical protein